MIIEITVLMSIYIIVYYVYVYKKNHYRFDKHGIKYVPGVPVFGNKFRSTLMQKHFIEELDEVYKAFPDERYVGFVEGTKPLILIRDPELMKLITIKDFDHFVNRKIMFPEDVAPVLGNSLPMMENESWQEMRTKLSPSFTGSKLKQMFPLLIEASRNIIAYLKDRQSQEVNIEDLMRRYTNDAIVSTTLGIQVNSAENRNNKFYKTGVEAVDFDFKQSVSYFLAWQFPILRKLLKYLNIYIIPSDGIEYFREVVGSAIKYRKENNINRPDFMHILMEISDEWTADEIAGQAYFAFIAGFESSASILTMCTHELAINPEVQEKLYLEIKTHDNKSGELAYEDISRLKYLDCVLNETFRKWSIAIMMDRVCTKPYVLPPPAAGGKPYMVNAGELTYSVVNPVHMDPQYHPNPEVFNPDRFSEENKHKIKPFTFMPYGMGPRNCLGLRLANLQMKVILYYIVLNFKMVKCAKTSNPIRLKPNELKIQAIGGTWVQCEARN